MSTPAAFEAAKEALDWTIDHLDIDAAASAHSATCSADEFYDALEALRERIEALTFDETEDDE